MIHLPQMQTKLPTSGQTILLFLLLIAPSCATRNLTQHSVPPQTFTRCMDTTIGRECLLSTDGLNWAPVQRVEVIR